jgi:hypothetical protein
LQKIRASLENGGQKEGNYWLLPPPPFPLTSETRDWHGFYKMCLQNLEPQGVRGQNLENKALGGPGATSVTATPGAIMPHLKS